MEINTNILENSEKIECKHCGCNMFVPGYWLLRVPASLSPTGEMGVAPALTLFICSDCGEPYIDETSYVDEN